MPYQSSGRLAELILRHGDARARAELARGDAWAGAIQGAGNAAQNTLASLLQYQQDEPKREAQALELKGLKADDAARTQTIAENQAIGKLLQESVVPGPNGRPTVDRAKFMEGVKAHNLGHRTDIFTMLDKIDPPAQLMERDPTKDIVNKETGTVVTPGTPAPVRGVAMSPGGVMKNPVTGEQMGEAVPLKPAAPSNPTEASLAAAAAAGDKNALKALELIRGQRREPQGPQPSYSWAMDPASGKEVFATADEIRANGYERAPSAIGTGGAAIQLRNSRAAAALNGIARLKKLAPERVPGPLGIAQGVAEVAKGYAGYNTDARQYQALIQPTAMQMAAAVQGAANLSDSERRAMAETLGSIHTMDYASQLALLDSAADLVKSGADVEEVDGHWIPVNRVMRLKTGTKAPEGTSSARKVGRFTVEEEP